MFSAPSGSERASPGTTDNFEVAAEPAELQLREKGLLDRSI